MDEGETGTARHTPIFGSALTCQCRLDCSLTKTNQDKMNTTHISKPCSKSPNYATNIMSFTPLLSASIRQCQEPVSTCNEIKARKIYSIYTGIQNHISILLQLSQQSAENGNYHCHA
jgi:hypothetical protein